MPRIAIISAAGGCGRTSLTAALATLATRTGGDAIALDWDPVNALALHLGAPECPEDGLVHQVAVGGEAVALQAADGTLVLPHGAVDGPALQDLERRLTSEPDWLGARLTELDLPPDGWVFIDTPRWPSVHARQAVRAADAVLVVMQADAAALDLAVPLMQRLAARQVLGVVNLFDPSRELQSDVLAELRERLGDRLAPQPVHRDAALPEAVARRLGAVDVAPHSHAAHDLRALLQWVGAKFELAVPVQSGSDAH